MNDLYVNVVKGFFSSDWWCTFCTMNLVSLHLCDNLLHLKTNSKVQNIHRTFSWFKEQLQYCALSLFWRRGFSLVFFPLNFFSTFPLLVSLVVWWTNSVTVISCKPCYWSIRLGWLISPWYKLLESVTLTLT